MLRFGDCMCADSLPLFCFSLLSVTLTLGLPLRLLRVRRAMVLMLCVRMFVLAIRSHLLRRRCMLVVVASPKLTHPRARGQCLRHPGGGPSPFFKGR